MKYSNLEKTVIIDEETHSFIPVDPNNMDYAEILASEVEIDDYVAPTKTWVDKRTEAYGSWQEQLDMMYHETWKDHVKSVKDENPKE